MSMINFTLNGKPASAEAGSTILKAAEANGVFIPTLCHDDRLAPFGSCMLCRVEVEGARGTLLACGAEVKEGMVVTTESPAIEKSRRVCIELLLSEHRGDCVAPCTLTCPAHIDIQGYIKLIREGKYEEALQLIKQKNPLPVVCGRVCTRPCEGECRRNLVDERVGIDWLKRFVADYDMEHDKWLPEKKPASGKKIAVIGAGPAGLSCAWFSLINGHEVTIFERHPKAGGMLRYGIPSYRLPRADLDAEIHQVERLGAEIRYGVDFGKDITAESLKKDGYDAIFLGVGSQKGWNLGCEGEDCCLGVLSGVDFLGGVEMGRAPDMTGRSVIVVGGGNTAIDAARTSLRLGAAQVKIVYRRGRAEMPANEDEIEAAEFEGVELFTLANPKAVKMDGGKIAATCVKMALGEPDASGRRRPVEVEGSEFVLDADYVVAAIGQTQDLDFVGEGFALDTVKGKIAADEDSGATNMDGVFAGGDAVTGPATAIKAIAAGGRAAKTIDAYFAGVSPAYDAEYFHTKGKKLADCDPDDFADFEKKPKQHPEEIPLSERRSFKEVEKAFTQEQAAAEANRCLECGCGDAAECRLRVYAAQFGADQYAFAGERSKPKKKDDSHPVFVRDPNKCILCGRCVRICTEVQEAGIFGFRGRGYRTVTEPYLPGMFEGEKACENCRLCVSTCPTGALLLK